ncbi:MAG: GNAT family N-acetyltransferase [Amaricoccus sp.]
MSLATDRLILRPWEPRDLEPFAALNADPAVMRFFPQVLTREESDAMVNRLAERWLREGICFGVAERRGDGAFVGMVGLAPVTSGPHQGSVEIGWRLARPMWGQGYATEAARAWLAEGFVTLGLPEIVAFAVPGNLPSRAVMGRIGMHPDPARDFEHPALPEGHPLRFHVFHAISRADWDRR